ncbi:MAG: hypothetical protein KC615_11480 [Anaerolineae bacterium]|nr:hypothetical protein [Anaerolineae bacterium]
MSLFIVFVVGAVIIGAGAMLSPTWPTSQPRVGLSAAFSLALLVGGAVWWSSLFAWETLVIDYMMFALVSFVVLGGTLSGAQARAEERGEELEDRDMGWPGPQDLVFLALVGIVAVLPLVLTQMPPGYSSAETGYLTLTAKLGGTLDTLAPFHPTIRYLHPPGYPAIVAYLSAQMHQPIPLVLFGLGTVLVMIAAWGAYDLGSEIADKRLGRALIVALLVGLGMLRTFLGGDFTLLMGLAFGITAVTFLMRTAQGGNRSDAIGAGLMLGATIIASFELGLVLLLGYVALLVGMLLPGRERPSGKTWLMMTVGVLAALAFGIGPWVARNWDLLTTVNRSSAAAELSTFLGFNAILLPLALVGLWAAWVSSERLVRWMAVVSVIWLLLILDVAVIGILPSVLPMIRRLVDPNALAQLGAMIPLAILGGIGVLWLWEQIPQAWRGLMRDRVYWLAGAAGVVLVLIIVASESTWQFLRTSLDLPEVASTPAETAAALWAFDNLPDDARILTEDHLVWLPVLTERDASSAYIFAESANEPEAVTAFTADALPDWLNNHETGPIGNDWTHIVTTLPDDSIDVTVSQLDESSALRLIYDVDGVQVWEITK